MASYAPTHPWRADWSDAEPGSLIAIRDAKGQVVCYVDYDDKLRAERAIATIEAWSALVTGYADMEDAGIRAAIRRIAQLAIMLFSTVGITLGFVAALS